MLRKTRCLVALTLLTVLDHAPVSIADGPPFIGRLGQGTVELVGISYYRPTNQARWWKRAQWWRPDGTAARIGRFRPWDDGFAMRPLADKKTVAFLVRVTLPFDRSLADKYVPSEARSSDRYLPSGQLSSAQDRYGQSEADVSWPAWEISPAPRDVRGSAPWEGHNVVDVHGDVLPDYRMYAAHFDAYTQMADFRASVSTSAYEWETVMTWQSDSAGTSSFQRSGKEWPVVFYKARKAPKATPDVPAGSTQARLAIPFVEFYGRLKTRLVAVDNDGSEHASLIGYVGNNGTAVFRGLPLSSINELQFQVRPYDWVEFKNVSLRPGQKTVVTVISSMDSAGAEK